MAKLWGVAILLFSLGSLRYGVSMTMARHKLYPVASIHGAVTRTDMTRTSKRPTTAFHTFSPERIQEVILGVFKRQLLSAMDMEALIFFVLQEFHVSPISYEVMHKTVKAHILKNFAIHQGASLRLSDVSMRRITVCHTIEQCED